MGGLGQIQIIYNNDGFKELREVFKKLSKERNLGVFKEGEFFNVGTSFMFRKVDTVDKEIFNKTQRDSKEKGFLRNIYSFKM